MSQTEIFNLIAQTHNGVKTVRSNIERAIQGIEFDIGHLCVAAMTLLLKIENINEFDDLRRYTIKEIYKLFGQWAEGWMCKETLTIDHENIKCKFTFRFKQNDDYIGRYTKEVRSVEIRNNMLPEDDEKGIIKLDITEN